ncbi:MAG: hypothetical protein QOE64_1793, partial [Frankiales bacterium]|nr:hypothetical protein [Frankiales bacterium]
MNSSTRPFKSTRFLAGLATVLLVVSAAFAVLLIVGAVAGFTPTGHEVSTRLTYDKAQLRPIGPTLIPSDSFDLTVHVKHPPRA